MNRFLDTFWKYARIKGYPLLGKHPSYLNLKFVANRTEANQIIISTLERNTPCMIARFGSNELNAIANYIGVNNSDHSFWKFLRTEIPEWWWSISNIEHMQSNAGFFPANEYTLSQYAELCIEDSTYVDILGSWQIKEYFLRDQLKLATKIRLRHLEPDFFTYDASHEWTQCLAGKKVLVVHPFADTIQLQYHKKDKLFFDPNFLPDFDLQTLKAVQSIGGSVKFNSWFDALDYMKNQVTQIDFDIAIIGCGAYGFNIAAHVKRLGKKAIHLGGATQLLFGITGRRWEERADYRKIINEHWTRPMLHETPTQSTNVENGCYW